MTDLLFHPQTKGQIEALQRKGTHALILFGPEGAGKFTLATELIHRQLQLSGTDRLQYYPYYLHINAENQTISIEGIRELQRFLARKTTGSGEIRRAVLIQDAQYMTKEAQNALLKNLEEPPADTVIVLTVDSPPSLLPTIRSRAQLIAILPLGENEVHTHFKEQGFKDAEIQKAYHLSNGLPGLLSALLHSDNDHEMYKLITQAKQLLSATSFDRLSRVDELAKQKDVLPQLFQAFALICKAALGSATNAHQSTKLIGSLQALQQANLAVERSANPKLLLTALFLHL